MIIHYDGECPFCARYVALVRLREAVGPVRLADLREDPEARARFEAMGLDPDDGMIVETGGKVYHGAEAINVISMMSSRSGGLNRLAATVLGVPLLARLLYPLLRAGRNAALFFLGRRGFGVADADETAFLDLFARFLGLFTVLDVFIYFFSYFPLRTLPTMPLLLGLGLALFLRPRWRPGLVLVMLVGAVDAWLQAPLFSNHAIIRNMFGLAFVAAGLWHWLRGSRFEAFFADVRPIGRGLLLLMYVFGIFHKLNTGFLDPAVSCAVVLWQKMPAPLAALDGPVMQPLAIYGTFITEGAVLVMLLVRRLRGPGIVIGIGFHALLALSNHAMYVPFSTLAILLHLLFLSPPAARRIIAGPIWQRFDALLTRPSGIVIVLALLATIALAAFAGDYSIVGLVWLALLALPMAAIFVHGSRDAAPAAPEPGNRLLWSRLVPLNAVVLLFLLNGFAPYLGLKTAQTINMFSNLRIEGDRSNHLLFSGKPGPFHYLDEVVTFEAASGNPLLERYARTRTEGMVPHQFHATLMQTPQAVVTYWRGGVRHGPMTGAQILMQDKVPPSPALARRFFHFRPVPLTDPVHCAEY